MESICLNRKHFKLPIDICFFIAEKKFYRQLQVYLYLKAISNGKVKIDIAILKEVRDYLNLKSIKTIKYTIEKLIQLNWIGFNETSKCYYIRGFDTVRKMYGFNRRTAIFFEFEYVNNIRPFIIAAIISYLNYLKKRKEKKEERKKVRSSQFFKPFASYYLVSNIYLANIIKVSLTTAYRLKREAHDLGYIQIKKNYSIINVNYKEASLYRKANPEYSERLRIVPCKTDKFKLAYQLPDLVKSNLKLVTRWKKIKTYIKVY